VRPLLLPLLRLHCVVGALLLRLQLGLLLCLQLLRLLLRNLGHHVLHHCSFVQLATRLERSRRTDSSSWHPGENAATGRRRLTWHAPRLLGLLLLQLVSQLVHGSGQALLEVRLTDRCQSRRPADLGGLGCGRSCRLQLAGRSRLLASSPISCRWRFNAPRCSQWACRARLPSVKPSVRRGRLLWAYFLGLTSRHRGGSCRCCFDG
jgi:hypothetical protein